MSVHGRVEVAGAGSHDQALQRGEPHRRVDRLPAADGRCGGTVAQVEDDQVGLVHGFAEQARGLPADEGVRGPVEPVAADPVLLAPRAGNRVGVRDGRHGLVERGVEDRHLGYVGEQLAGDHHPLEVGRVVQRSEGHQLSHLVDQRVVDENRLGEAGAPVHDPMTHRCHLGVGQRRAVGVERVQHRGQRLLDRGALALGGMPVVAGRVLQLATGLADPLDRPGRRRRAGLGVDEAVLQGRRSRVEDQHVGAHERPWAWIAVIAMVFTMSRTVAPRDKSLTGLRSPWRTGPTASAPAERCTAL